MLVVRLLVGGSVEEHIVRTAAEKAKFADSSITGGPIGGRGQAAVWPKNVASGQRRVWEGGAVSD